MRPCFSTAEKSLVEMINKSVSASKYCELSRLALLGCSLLRIETDDGVYLSPMLGTLSTDPFIGDAGARIDLFKFFEPVNNFEVDLSGYIPKLCPVLLFSC